MPTPLDPQARKQLLLTRIAIERAEWVRDVDGLRRQLVPTELLNSWLRQSGRGHWTSALFGQGGGANASFAGWPSRLLSIVLMVRRHPLWWPLIAGALPWWRSRNGAAPRRTVGSKALLILVGVATGVGAWWMSRKRGTPARDQGV